MKKEVRKILLKTKKSVYGEMLGNNDSLFQGEGFTFAELREYIYGDDVRKIDWKTTAKLGKPFVKIYHEERELNVVALSMLSGSTYFGTTRQKYEVMAEVVATLGFSAVKNSDLFSSYLFADRLYAQSKPSKREFGIWKSVDEMLSFDMLGKEANFSAMVQMLHKRLRRKALLFIVSDFVGDIDLTLLAKRHDIVAVMVRDRFEESPESLGYLRLIDMETKASFEGDISQETLKGYTNALRENDAKFTKQCKKLGIRLIKIYTDEKSSVKLMKGMR